MIGWTYDAAGNRLSDGTTTATYDALNRLTQQDGTSYIYNADGVLVSDGTTTYTQDLAAPLSQILADGSATYVYGAGSERLRALDGPWFLGDALGSVRTTLDAAGAVVATASYDPWGVPQGDLVAPFGFTGELHHGDQVYLRARWYTPGWGTFPSRDPFAGFPEMPYSLHAYQYAYSAPTVWTDPSGENPLVCLVPAVADGPMPVGDAVSVVCLVGYGLYAGAVALAGALTIDTAVTTLPNIMTPPLDPGPPESPVLRGAPQYVPARDDHLVSSPLTGPEEACWVIPGPLLMPPPWPFTTGAPLDPVQGPVVWMAKRKLGDLQPLHQPGLNPDRARDLRKLTDQQLLDAVKNPADGEFLKVRPGENVVIDGNTRLYEMLQRMQQNLNSIFHRDLDIPVIEEPRQPLDPSLPDDY